MSKTSNEKRRTPLVHDGLYVILDPSICPDRSLVDVLKVSATAGAKNFQYRNKTASMKVAYAEALALRKIAQELGVLFIVNDRCDLALAVDADGVHLGQGDLPFHLARNVMGPDKLIGLSTHDRDQVILDEDQAAREQGGCDHEEREQHPQHAPELASPLDPLRRLRGDDLIVDLFDLLHGLH